MSVNPGFGGQKFIEGSLKKIETLKGMIDERNLDVLIEVDGGIKTDNASRIVKAGADILVMGSAFFHADDYSALMKDLRNRFSN